VGGLLGCGVGFDKGDVMNYWIDQRAKQDAKEMFPKTAFVGGVIAVVCFFCTWPIGYLLGALWDGLRSGFLLGQD
jgi:hypothetical protein